MQSWPMMKGITVYTPFVLTIEVSDSSQLALRNIIWPNYKGVIDWGDGTVSDYSELPNTEYIIYHTYSAAGRYRLSIWYSDDCPKYVQPDPTNEGLLASLTGRLVEINTILPKIFENMTQAYRICADCSMLVKVPEKLFSNTKNIWSLYSAFVGCASLREIPKGLFKGLYRGIELRDIFEGCVSLTEIPEGLFDDFTSTSGLNFRYCFYGCTSLVYVPMNLFPNPGVLDFSSTFARCSAITSTVPELWISHSTATHTRCYYECTHAANYASIPTGWR